MKVNTKKPHIYVDGVAVNVTVAKHAHETLDALIMCKNELLFGYRNQGATLGLSDETVDEMLLKNTLYQHVLDAIKNATSNQ